MTASTPRSPASYGGVPARSRMPALQALYDELEPRVYGCLRSRGAAEPEDLTSEVFLAVCSRLGTVTGGAAGVRTLLFSMAHARLVDDLRRRSRRGPTTSFDPATDDRMSVSAEQDALAGLVVDEVRALLASLPDARRDVLLLRIVSDLSLEQVAAVMGRSTGAVTQLQRRGPLALRAAYAQRGVPR